MKRLGFVLLTMSLMVLGQTSQRETEKQRNDTSSFGKLTNVTLNEDMQFCVNDGGVESCNLVLDGPTSYVGVGIASPSFDLEIQGDGVSNNGTLLRLIETGAGTDSFLAVADELRVGFAGSPTNQVQFLAQSADGVTDKNRTMGFFTSGTERFYIGNGSLAGRVVINRGGTTPTHQFELRGNGNQMRIIDTADESFAEFEHDGGLLRIRNNATSGGFFAMNTAAEVGIGIEAIQTNLHVFDGDSGVASGPTDEGVLIESATDGALTYFTPNNAAAIISFDDPEEKQAGKIQYNHSGNTMQFATDAAAGASVVRMTLTEGEMLMEGDGHEVQVAIDADASNDAILSLEQAGVVQWDIKSVNGVDDRLAVLDAGGVEAMTIEQDGSVGINQSAPGGDMFQVNKDVNGAMEARFRNTNAGSSARPILSFTSDGGSAFIGRNSIARTANGGAESFHFINESGGMYLGPGDTSWGSLSDERSKENWVELSGALTIISGWRAGKYNLISQDDTNKKIGLIAQDVMATLPEVVTTSNPNEYGVKYSEIIPVLVKAIQELEARVDALENP